MEIGKDQLLRPLWGGLSEPFLFLLRELRRRYRSDWDDAVNAREQVFRNDLYNLFQSERFYKLRRNVVIKNGRTTITDIDALIVDRKTGEAGIFQLKWQDFIGNSMQARESKKRNLLETANRWIENVLSWISFADTKALARTFGLVETDVKAIRAFRVFVIGRNSASFSGDWKPDTRAAWGTWPQFLRLLTGLPDYRNPVKAVFHALQEDSPLIRPPPEIDSEELRVGDITINISS